MKEEMGHIYYSLGQILNERSPQATALPGAGGSDGSIQQAGSISETVGTGEVSVGSSDVVFSTLSPKNWVIGDAFTSSLAKLFIAIAVASVVVMAMVAVAIYGVSRQEAKGAAKDLVMSKLVIVAFIGAGALLLDGVFALAVALF